MTHFDSLDELIEGFYKEHGVEESKRRLFRFYHAYLQLFETYMPDLAKITLETAAEYESGRTTLEALIAARLACHEWLRSHRSPGTPTPAYASMQAVNVVAYQGEDIATDDDLIVDMDMFVFYLSQIEERPAELEERLRAAFESS